MKSEEEIRKELETHEEEMMTSENIDVKRLRTELHVWRTLKWVLE